MGILKFIDARLNKEGCKELLSYLASLLHKRNVQALFTQHNFTGSLLA